MLTRLDGPAQGAAGQAEWRGLDGKLSRTCQRGACCACPGARPLGVPRDSPQEDDASGRVHGQGLADTCPARYCKAAAAAAQMTTCWLTLSHSHRQLAAPAQHSQCLGATCLPSAAPHYPTCSRGSAAALPAVLEGSRHTCGSKGGEPAVKPQLDSGMPAGAGRHVETLSSSAGPAA